MTPARTRRRDEPRPCPICGGAARGEAFPFEQTWEGVLYRHVKCASCGSTFVDPLPDEGALQRIYTWDSYHATHYGNDNPGRFSRSLAVLGALSSPGMRLLDFGCGSGEFLRLAQRTGLECRGVELEPTTIQRASQQASVPVTSLEELEALGIEFDFVHMNDVVPHLADAPATFRRLERVVSSRGVFIVSGPLESNRSLVFWTAAGCKRVRRCLRLQRTAPVIPPTMLVRVDRAAQRRFFEQRLGYEERLFEVYETGWPYRQPDPSRRRSLVEHTRHLIGSFAVRLASVQMLAPLQLGNRFVAVYALRHPRPTGEQ